MNWNLVPPAASSFLTTKSTVLATALLALSSLQSPARSEPTAFEPLQSVIIGTGDGDQELQAVWDGALRPKMQTFNVRFDTASGVYLLSIKKDRCVNTGNVPNLFACPARLAAAATGKLTVLQSFDLFYFSGELPTDEAAPTYISQTGRNRTRVALDAEQGVLLVQDTNNGSTGTRSLAFPKP
jgi:hypothetical protein